MRKNILQPTLESQLMMVNLGNPKLCENLSKWKDYPHMWNVLKSAHNVILSYKRGTIDLQTTMMYRDMLECFFRVARGYSPD
jgi:hypothetical protein